MNIYSKYKVVFIGLLSFQITTQAQLPPDPNQWVCKADYSESKLKKMGQEWCNKNLDGLDFNWRKNTDLPMEPGLITELEKKNNYDNKLRTFLNGKSYQKWPHDQEWRLTGPYVGDIGSGDSFGVHPGVRIYYSPQVVKWMCTDRSKEIGEGALIIKEMHDIDSKLGVKIDKNNCMSVPDSEDLQPTSWTVMVKSKQSHDGWYWANPTPSGGNPPIVDKSAFMQKSDVPKSPVKRNEDWYPTGYLFGQKLPNGNPKVFNTVYPYSLFGAACINCHASAANDFTFSSLDNIVSAGLQYKHYPAAATKSKQTASTESTLHSQALIKTKKKSTTPIYKSPFSSPLKDVSDSFMKYYGDLEIRDFSEAYKLRFPAETYDHNISAASGLDQFLTSDQCINCHDATYANSGDANMTIPKANSDLKINVSPYGEWRASPMGLAGRDPIFFSQLQSETNNLPEMKECIENTCLHCHGVMGERQQSIDHPQTKDNCADLFAIPPPKGVPLGKPFAKETVTKWQSDPKVPDNHDAKYGALARDGISCMVCHQMTDTAFGEEAGFTGNFVTNKPGTVVGPYEKVTVVPMENALGITPEFGAQISSSDMCGSCHNILLPTLNNDGSPHETKAPNGQIVSASYEQTTHLEWLNSDFAKPGTAESCIDCHMPTKYQVGETNNPLKDLKIANIESSAFPPTTHRLPDDEITLTPREQGTFARHSLHGLNLFLNEMFQQFPMILGIRQLDYMTKSDVQPSLITGNESMREMATQETADVAINSMKVNGNVLDVEVEVTNKTGHFLPSGVGFRRVFLEFIVKDTAGKEIWASGKTTDLGVITNGLSGIPLASEKGVKGTTQYQPHYQTITSQDQVQIYQELIKDSEGHLTTSFLRRVDEIKDNRLRGKGFDPKFYLKNKSPYIQMLGELKGKAAEDAYYSDPKLTGSDVLNYKIKFDDSLIKTIGSISVRLFNQSIPPAYLQDRFSDAKIKGGEKDDIQRLFYMTSHLNTTSDENGKPNSIKDWKIYLTGACQSLNGKSCGL
jgi:mono/diheme cytochrome c family protein